jgi:hypothetical protein
MDSDGTCVGLSASMGRLPTCSTRPAGTRPQPVLATGADFSLVGPVEAVTDAALIYPAVLEELLPAPSDHVEQHQQSDRGPITASSSTG